MKEKTERDNRTLVAFWDRALALSDGEREQAREGGDAGWKESAPSEKLYQAAASLGGRRKVLDYGCGGAWAGIIAAKCGCRDVTAADAAPGAVETARFYADLYGVGDRVKACLAPPGWLGSVPSETYDGFFCSNVLDVVPPETAGEILRESARIVTGDASVIVGLNYFLSPEAAAARGLAPEEGRMLYIDGVLRLVSRTDEEWEEFFSPLYRVTRLEHFAWLGEKEEKRRLFYLRRR